MVGCRGALTGLLDAIATAVAAATAAVEDEASGFPWRRFRSSLFSSSRQRILSSRVETVCLVSCSSFSIAFILPFRRSLDTRASSRLRRMRFRSRAFLSSRGRFLGLVLLPPPVLLVLSAPSGEGSSGDACSVLDVVAVVTVAGSLGLTEAEPLEAAAAFAVVAVVVLGIGAIIDGRVMGCCCCCCCC